MYCTEQTFDGPCERCGEAIPPGEATTTTRVVGWHNRCYLRAQAKPGPTNAEFREAARRDFIERAEASPEWQAFQKARAALEAGDPNAVAMRGDLMRGENETSELGRLRELEKACLLHLGMRNPEDVREAAAELSRLRQVRR